MPSPQLQQRTTALAYSRAETNFTLGLVELDRRLKRRSLVVVLTDFVDTVTAELMVENLARLARRHLVLLTTLRDRALDRVAARRAARPRSTSTARWSRATCCASGRWCCGGCGGWAPTASRRLRRRLGTRLINRYLDIKRRELV